MATNFFNPSNVDLDSIYELASDFPSVSAYPYAVNFFAGSQDISSRYIGLVGTPAANTGMRVATPAVSAYTETINEGGEIIEIYHPAIPAGDKDLSSLFAAKGNVAGYYNYPRVGTPSSAELVKNLSIAKSGSGSVAGSASFSFAVPSVLLNVGDTVTGYTVSGASLMSGTIYQALNGGAISRLANNYSYRKTYTVGLTTVTSYVNGSGSSEARYRLTLYVTTASGKRSDAAASPHTSGKTITFDVVLNHTVTPSGGDGGGPIQ